MNSTCCGGGCGRSGFVLWVCAVSCAQQWVYSVLSIGTLESEETGLYCRDGFHSLGSFGLGFVFFFFFKLALAGFAFFALLFPTALKILNVYEFGPHSI